jgi:DNA repair exonuclease SbcCD nuclease subunit
MNFVHMADLHLGYKQYDLDQRLKDFGSSFMKAVQYAIDARADFVLISGDLFNSRNINAPTFIQAHHVLSMLKDAGIPCIAIAGNHDRAFVRDHMSWLETLEWQGLLRVIKPGERRIGNHVDIGDVRIFGLGYAGSSTGAIIPLLAEEIREINAAYPPKYSILMMHAGIAGQMKGNIIGETPYEDFLRLKGLVDYLALGHYHCAYELDGWAFNPGCPDTCSLAEVGEPRGFYHVRDGKATLVDVPRRPFILASVKLDEHLDATSLLQALEKKVASIRKPVEQPVVIVSFRGCLGFDRSHIDPEQVREIVSARLDPLYVDVRFDLSNDPFSIAGLEAESIDRAAVEREVLSRFAASDSMLSGYSHYFAAAISEAKDLAIKGADLETLDALMRSTFEAIKNKAAHETEKALVVVVPEDRLPEKPAAKPAKEKKNAGEETPVPRVRRKTLDEYWGNKP